MKVEIEIQAAQQGMGAKALRSLQDFPMSKSQRALAMLTIPTDRCQSVEYPGICI
jgi:hypothetical protein